MGPPLTEPSGLVWRYFTASVHSANLVLIPSRPAMMSQRVAPGPPSEIATATPAMFPIPTVPRHCGRERLEGGDLARLGRIGVAAPDQVQRVREAAHVDEAQVQGEEHAPRDEPRHDEGDVGAGDGHGVEDEAGDRVGDRLHPLVDQLV